MELSLTISEVWTVLIPLNVAAAPPSLGLHTQNFVHVWGRGLRQPRPLAEEEGAAYGSLDFRMMSA